MKIFAAGDFHGDRTHVRKLVKELEKENVDAIILNGDLVEEVDVEGVVGEFAALGKPVLLIPGNHESEATIDFLSMRYGGVNIHKNYKIIGNVAFIGMGGADSGFTQVSESEIYDELNKNFEKISGVKTRVLVSHMPPTYTAMEKMSRFVKGSLGLRKVVEKFKPEVVICGHVHEAAGLEEKVGSSTVVNVGRHGKIIEL